MMSRSSYLYRANRSSALCTNGTKGKPEICDPACAAAAGTPSRKFTVYSHHYIKLKTPL
jgi:hypothetical protein